MNESIGVLQDIELALVLSENHFFMIMALLAVALILVGVIWFWYKRQRPLNKAIRNLNSLKNVPSKPAAIHHFLLLGLQEKRLADSSLPANFIQCLEQARFSPTPCSPDAYLALKQEAVQLLQKIQAEKNT